MINKFNFARERATTERAISGANEIARRANENKRGNKKRCVKICAEFQLAFT